MSKGAKAMPVNGSQELKQTGESLTMEARKLEAQLLQSLQLSDAALKQMEARFNNEIHVLEIRVKAIEELLAAINAQVQNGHAQIQAHAEENLRAQERISSEIESLASELKEKKILLAAYEKAHWRSNGKKNLWQRLFRRQTSP